MVALVVGLIGAFVVTAPPAFACPQSASNCSETGQITMNANSTGSQSTDVVPTKSTKGTEFATPFTSAELDDFDSNWETISDAFPKLGGIKNVFVRRVITCAVFAKNVTKLNAVYQTRVNGSTSAAGTDTSELFLTLCLQMVYETQLATGSHAVRAASAGCGVAVVSIPIQIRRSGSRYTARFNATPTRAGHTPLVVGCRTKGNGVQISMRPRSRRQTLHQVIGNHMSIGFSNPTSRPVRIKTTFSFAR